MRIILRLRGKAKPARRADTAAEAPVEEAVTPVASLIPEPASAVSVERVEAPTAESTAGGAIVMPNVPLIPEPASEHAEAPVAEAVEAVAAEAASLMSKPVPKGAGDAARQPAAVPAGAARPVRIVARCKRCGSLDVWRFGRVTSLQRILANACRGQWATCRRCGKRFITDVYGPMRREEDD